MTPKRFTVIDKDPPFFIGDSLWRIDETTARAAVPSDDCNSENFLTVVYNTDRPDPICSNKNTVFILEPLEEHEIKKDFVCAETWRIVIRD